ncbi:glutathione S-transferase family protein [Enterovirga sp. CN4-39]|uniref:glutathione S-transferase family protein n=1 Tax=Enterovirga sp. CN4-39 TaxID=3400910 RepID=UPI003C0235DE
MRLWHCVDARSFRVLWALEELGLDYELILLGFPPRVRDRRIFEVNPLGTVPAFEAGRTVMTESSAICEWLAEQHPASRLSVATDEPARAEYLNWLHQADTTLTFPQAVHLRYAYLETEDRRLPQAAEDYRRWFLGRLKLLSSALASRDYVCAGRFTMADIAVSYALSLSEDLGLDADLPGVVRAYLRHVTDRDGWRRAKAAQEEAARAAGLPVEAPARLLRRSVLAGSPDAA